MNRIIKGTGEPPSRDLSEPAAPRSRVMQGDEFDARHAANTIVADAERAAALLRDTAARDAEDGRARAEREGYEAGIARAAELAARIAAERDAWLAGQERDIFEIALAAAAKILGREVADRGAAADIVAQALGAARRARSARVRIAPSDAAVVRAQEASLLRRLASGAVLEIVEDPAIPAGGCVIETDSGRIDGRLETQLTALRRALLGEGEGAP